MRKNSEDGLFTNALAVTTALLFTFAVAFFLYFDLNTLTNAVFRIDFVPYHRTPAGARRVRLTQLMEEHHGDIDVQVAEEILADHYDVYLEKENPGSRTVEGRYDLDAFEFWPVRLPFAPQGAVDGKVMDSDMAQDLSFWARWGSSSGMPFDAGEHIDEHPQWDHLAGYLKDRPSQPWTLFKAGEG